MLFRRVSRVGSAAEGTRKYNVIRSGTRENEGCPFSPPATPYILHPLNDGTFPQLSQPIPLTLDDWSLPPRGQKLSKRAEHLPDWGVAPNWDMPAHADIVFERFSGGTEGLN